jgi:HNH endonuclease
MRGIPEMDSLMVFHYPDTPLPRRHGPRGYLRYEAYKPWLRDEFLFRCVYCLCRERWVPGGDESFSVDHFLPQSVVPERRTDYDNLVYACCSCNSSKQDYEGVLDPSREPVGNHLQVGADGTIHGLTPQGVEWIRVCRLDRPRLTEFCRQLLELLAILTRRKDPQAATLFQHYLGFPLNLPRLTTLRPPGGNARPGGIADSCFERKRRGELPDSY